jgi:hypothetical protein
MYGFIHQAIAESNQGYVNSNISITLKLKCLIASDIQDNISSNKMLEDLLAGIMAAIKSHRAGLHKRVHTRGHSNIEGGPGGLLESDYVGLYDVTLLYKARDRIEIRLSRY